MRLIKLCLGTSRSFAIKLLFLTAFWAGAQEALADVCWKSTYGRGVGIIPGECDSVKKEVKSGLLCYPKPKEPGWHNVAGIERPSCPSGFRDDGLTCWKPGAYGRGTTWFIKGNCDNAHKDVGGCDYTQGGIYPKCKKDFHEFGCCICTPDCPPGMADRGAHCEKPTRLMGPITPGCGANMQYDAGLCYNKCSDKYYGVGPVCWGLCPADKPVDCGAMCGTSVMDCLTSIGDIVWSIGESVYKIAGIISTLGISTGANLATDAAKEAAIAGLKETAKKMAKEIAKKLAGAAKTIIIGKVAAELKKLNVPDFLADKLAEMAADADNFDYLGFLSKLDPLGFGKIAVSFVKPICQVVPTVIPPAPTTQAAPAAPPKIIPRAAGPNPCAMLLAESKYTKLVDNFPSWELGDRAVAVAMLIDAAALPAKINDYSSSSMWSNKDLFGALTANCNLYRNASDFHELTSSVPPEKWTKEQRERVVGLVGLASGIRLVRLQELTNAQLSGLFTGAPGTCKDCKLEAAPPPQGSNVCQRIQTHQKYKAVKDNPPSIAMKADTLALLGAAIPIDWNNVLARKPTVFGDSEHLHMIIRSINCQDFETNPAWKDNVPGLRKLVTIAPDQWTSKQRDAAEVAVTRLTKLEPVQVQLFSNKELLEFLRGL